MRFIDDVEYADVAKRLDVGDRFRRASERLEHIKGPGYLQALVGSLGADPLGPARMSEGQVINWARARYAAATGGTMTKEAVESLQVQGMPTLLQRFRSRFTKSGTN